MNSSIAEFNINVEGLPPEQRKQKFADELAHQVCENRKQVTLAKINEIKGTSFTSFDEMLDGLGDSFLMKSTGAEFPIQLIWLDGKALCGYLPPIIETKQRENDPHTADCDIREMLIPADEIPDDPEDLPALHQLFISCKMNYMLAKLGL